MPSLTCPGKTLELPNVGSRRVNCCQAGREKELAGEESLLGIPGQELRMQELGMWSLSPSLHHLLQLSPGETGAMWLAARERGWGLTPPVLGEFRAVSPLPARGGCPRVRALQDSAVRAVPAAGDKQRPPASQLLVPRVPKAVCFLQNELNTRRFNDDDGDNNNPGLCRALQSFPETAAERK